MSKNQSGPNANLPESCSTSNMIAYKRWWRARRKASGVCTTCGGERDSARHVRCSRCRDAEKESLQNESAEAKAWRLSKIKEGLRVKRAGWEAEGLCNWCGAVRDIPNRKRCAKCQEKARKANNRRASKLRNQGLCPHCGKKPETDRRLCNKCRLIAKEEYRRLIARRSQLEEIPEHAILTCFSCGEEKPAAAFRRNRKSRTGRNPSCTACRKQWYVKNRETIRQRVKAARLANPEKFRQQSRAAYRKLMEAYSRGEKPDRRQRELLKAAARRIANREAINEQIREIMRRKRAADPEGCRQRERAWAAANRDKVTAIWHRYQQRKRDNGGSFTAAEWEAVKKRQNYTCLGCGRSEPEIKLSVDHIVPVSKKGHSNIDNIQGLCMRCNRRKSAKTIDLQKNPEDKSLLG